MITIEATSVAPGASAGIETFCYGLINGLCSIGETPQLVVAKGTSPAWLSACPGLPPSSVEAVGVALSPTSSIQRILRRWIPGSSVPPVLLRGLRGARARSVMRVSSARSASSVFFPFHRTPISGRGAVVTVHDLRVFQDAFRSDADRRIVAENIEAATAVVTSWPHPYGDIRSKFPEASQKLFMVPLPVFSRPPDGWDPDDKQTAGEAVALMPAAMSTHKNHENLLRALSLVSGLKLICTGPESEPLASDLRRLARDLGIESRVTFRGFVTRADLDRAFATASLVVMPTLWEAASGPILEAAAWGVPIAASNIEPIRSQLEQTNIPAASFDPSSPIEIAKAMELVLAEQSERARQTWAAGRKVAARTWSDTAADYGRIFDWARGDANKPMDLQPMTGGDSA